MHKLMMLTISNPFENDITYSAAILLLANYKCVDTSTVPVGAKLQTFEMWNDTIVSLVLMNFEGKNK